MTKYNLSNIMNKAWNLFRANIGTFAECLKKAWADAKALIAAIKESLIDEEVHTWYGWKQLGYEVIHESKCVFQIVVADAKTKSGQRTLSYFTRSQVALVEAAEV